MTREEIEIEVKRKYPKTEREKRGCWTEKMLMNLRRDEYRKKLEQEGIQREAHKEDEQV